MSWFEIPPVYLLTTDRIQSVEIEGQSLCLIYKDGKWIAFSRKCPHAGASFANGWCEGDFLICPLHRHGFDLKTGKGKSGQNNYITIYPTKSIGAKQMIYLQSSFWRRLFR